MSLQGFRTFWLNVAYSCFTKYELFPHVEKLKKKILWNFVDKKILEDFGVIRGWIP